LFASGGQNEPLNICEENNSIRVVGLSETAVNDAMSTIQLLEKSSLMRMTGGTAMNNESSRSYAIFSIIQVKNKTDLIKSKFYLADLAGSERQSKTKAEGIRLKESINNNLGLLTFGNVISVLGEDKKTNKMLTDYETEIRNLKLELNSRSAELKSRLEAKKLVESGKSEADKENSNVKSYKKKHDDPRLETVFKNKSRSITGE